MNYEILIGLPGSGKTYWSKEQALKTNVFRFDADEFMFNHNDLEALAETLKSLPYSEDSTVLIDGLFPDKTGLLLTNLLPLNRCKFIKFDTPLETCLANDRYRFSTGERTKLSTHSIKNIRFDSHISAEKCITGGSGLLVPSILVHLDESGSDILNSEHWDAGGSTYATCWDDENTTYTPTEPDEEPKIARDNFYEFFDFVYKLTGLDDSDIFDRYSHLVEVEDDSESDWYGGCEYFEFHTVSKTAIVNEMLSITGDVLLEDFKENNPGDFLCLTL